ncbi:snapalysin [Angustibacter peucedani]
MSIRTRARTTRLLTAAAGVAAAAALVATSPATSATSAVPTSHPQRADQGYTPGSRDDAQNAQLRKQLAQALATQKAQGSKKSLAVTTIYYDASNAPSFASEISQSASIWNSSVSNVRLVAGSPGDLTYYEGSDPSGSYYSGDGHGSGYILIDYDQANQYDPLRIVAHETGHNMGLPDHYSGPCSELMSGGGPGPSCTNPYPNSTESAQVNALWANGFAPRMAPAAAFAK